MRDDATVLRALMVAYKELVLITKEKMTADQAGHLLQVERQLVRALMHVDRNRLERFAIRRFVMKMALRDTDTDAP